MRLLNASHAWRTPLIIIDSWPAQASPLTHTGPQASTSRLRATAAQSAKGTPDGVPGAVPAGALVHAVRRLRQWWSTREELAGPSWAANDAPRPAMQRPTMRQHPHLERSLIAADTSRPIATSPTPSKPGVPAGNTTANAANTCIQSAQSRPTLRPTPHPALRPTYRPTPTMAADHPSARPTPSVLCAGARVLTGLLSRSRPGPSERGFARNANEFQRKHLNDKPGRPQAANSRQILGDARVVLRGRMADVCAELDRLVAIEAVQIRHQQCQAATAAPAH